MSTVLPRSVRRATILRSLLVQASWSYSRMIGLGMGWAMLPVLRHCARTSPAGGAPTTGAPHTTDVAGRVDAATMERHCAHFNAHPYFTGLALGSLAHLELEQATPEMITRFRSALRGPLGALGDRLIWAGWLPLCVMVTSLAFWLGVPVWICVAGFLGIYNTVHLAVRTRGFDVGLAEGARLAVRLREWPTAATARRLGAAGALAAGTVAGLLLSGAARLPTLPAVWIGIGATGFVFGVSVGARAWRPAAVLTVAAVVLLFIAGTTGVLQGGE